MDWKYLRISSKRSDLLSLEDSNPITDPWGPGIFTDPWIVDVYGIGRYTSPMDPMGTYPRDLENYCTCLWLGNPSFFDVCDIWGYVLRVCWNILEGFNTLQGDDHVSPSKVAGKIIFLFQWDMLVPKTGRSTVLKKGSIGKWKPSWASIYLYIYIYINASIYIYK